MSSVSTASGKILAVCVSKSKLVDFGRKQVLTGIFKEPKEGKLALRRLNLEGDEQADLTVHGGPDKALYVYPSEHYPWWRKEMPDSEFVFGNFGENLTTEGLLESRIYIGDRFRIGTAVVQVSQPRMPCYKLGIRFGRTDIIKKFLQSYRCGIYFSVLEEGLLGVGDDIEYLGGDEHKILLQDVARLLAGEITTPDLIQRVFKSNLADQTKDFLAGG